MKSKWTPWPWFVGPQTIAEHEGNERFPIGILCVQSKAELDGPEPSNVAFVPQSTDEEQEATAKVISAAPDLAEALSQSILQCAKCHGKGIYWTDCTLCGDSTFDHMCNDEERECKHCKTAIAALCKAGAM